MKKDCPVHSKKFKSQLKNSGLKITRTRLAMLDIFKHDKRPLNASEFERKLKSAGADRATIYRNLEILSKQKIITPVNLKKDQAYYELSGIHHHHIICEVCGKIVDVGNCGIHKLEYQVMKKHGFAKISRHELEFFGLCKKCSNK